MLHQGDLNSVYTQGFQHRDLPHAVEQGLKLTKRDEDIMSLIKLINNKEGVQQIKDYFKKEGENILSGEDETGSLQEPYFHFISFSLNIRKQIFSLKQKYQNLCVLNDGIYEEIDKLNKLIENLLKQAEEYNRFVLMFNVMNENTSEKLDSGSPSSVDIQLANIRVIINNRMEKAKENETQMCDITNIVNTLKKIITISPEELDIMPEKDKKDPELDTKALCIICSSRSIEFCLSGCGHCFCGPCSDKIKDCCHVCRTVKSKKIKLFYE